MIHLENKQIKIKDPETKETYTFLVRYLDLKSKIIEMEGIRFSLGWQRNSWKILKALEASFPIRHENITIIRYELIHNYDGRMFVACCKLG